MSAPNNKPEALPKITRDHAELMESVGWDNDTDMQRIADIETMLEALASGSVVLVDRTELEDAKAWLKQLQTSHPFYAIADVLVFFRRWLASDAQEGK